jgi:hypothetical protein
MAVLGAFNWARPRRVWRTRAQTRAQNGLDESIGYGFVAPMQQRRVFLYSVQNESRLGTYVVADSFPVLLTETNDFGVLWCTLVYFGVLWCTLVSPAAATSK